MNLKVLLPFGIFGDKSDVLRIVAIDEGVLMAKLETGFISRFTAFHHE